jgi:energy-coupling factor transporter transmembrane protein EcfT
MQGEHVPPDDRPWAVRVDELIESRVARVGLAVLVIVSLLPLGTLEQALRPVFLVVFGGELALRFALWRGGTRVTTVGGVVFGVADVLAFVSFLPLEGLFSGQGVQLLALLRLTRLFLLVRFARDLARDIYAILTRREQLQTLGLVTGAVVVLSFVAAVILSQLSIDTDNHQAGASFVERLWWSFRQLESADNLVQHLRGHPVLSVLSLALTLTGVFLISFIIGVGANIVDQVVRAERRRALVYRGHTVVVGAVHDGEDLVREFVRMYAKNRQIPSPERLWTWLRYARPSGPRTFPRVALLSRRDDPPDYLVEPIMRWVVYRQGDESEPESLRRIAASGAKRAIVLAHHALGWESDALTVSTVAALRAQSRDCHVYAEVDDPGARELVLDVGGPNTVALDVPRFLGLFLCQHLLIPGVERLYRDLLTADGSEIYTHIFVDGADHAALATRTAPFAWDDLVALAAEHGVVLVGVYVGPTPVSLNAQGVVPMAGLVRWLNPGADVEDPEVSSLGGRRGVIPADKLRGVIAVSAGYLPLRAFAAAAVAGRFAPVVASPTPGTVAALSQCFQPLPRGPARVALIGYSEALPALLHELSRFVPGVDVKLFLSARGDERLPLHRRLASLRVGLDEDAPLPGRDGCVCSLERGGRLQIFTHDAPDLAQFAATRMLDPVEAAVFLSEPEGGDRDARTTMRVLRFIRALEEGRVPRGERLHVLAEFLSVDKGEHVQRHVNARRCGFAHDDDVRLTLIAKETIKSYFMVHSAFVPGVAEIYDELLEERGQDIVRIPFAASSSAPSTVSLRELTVALAARQAVPLGLEMRDGVHLSPAADVRFATVDVRGIYAIQQSSVPDVGRAFP